MSKADILIFGAGSFATRILFDIAATAQGPVTVTVAARKPERLAWLKTGAMARAHMFARPVRVSTLVADLSSVEAADEAIDKVDPRVVVQAASSQGGSVIAARDNAWAKLVAEGGLSVTAVFQMQLTTRVALALKQSGRSAYFINCCYPDVTNSLLAARGLPVTSGIGNVSILSNAFAGAVGQDAKGPVRLLAHYQTISAFRRLPAERSGPMPRVWIGNEEVKNVADRFKTVQLTPEPVIDISGASGVPMMLAMAARKDWSGHAPGPLGLPGGYPVRLLSAGGFDLDLPAGLSRQEAIAWNAAFEEKNGLVVDAKGRARYTGVLAERLAALSPELAKGFDVSDLESVHAAMADLRTRLLSTPVR